MSVITIKRKTQKSVVPKHMRASAVLPVLAYDEDKQFFIMDDKTVGFGFFCDPLTYGDEKIQERVNGFLNQELPKKTTIQIVLFRSPDINQQMYKMLAIREGIHHNLMSDMITESEAFLKNHTHNPLNTSNPRGFYDKGVLQELQL